MKHCLSVRLSHKDTESPSQVSDAVLKYYLNFHDIARRFDFERDPNLNEWNILSLDHVTQMVQHAVLKSTTVQSLALQNLSEENQSRLFGEFVKKVDDKIVLLPIDDHDVVHPEHFVLYDHLMLCDKSNHPNFEEVSSISPRRILFSVLGPEGVGKSGTALRLLAQRGGIYYKPTVLDCETRDQGHFFHGYVNSLILCDFLAYALHFLLVVKNSKEMDPGIESKYIT